MAQQREIRTEKLRHVPGVTFYQDQPIRYHNGVVEPVYATYAEVLAGSIRIDGSVIEQGDGWVRVSLLHVPEPPAPEES